MSLNKTDTRQRAYNRIDASNQQGSWIDEKTYNKHGGKCLVGNWQEERVLDGHMGSESAVHKVIEAEGTRTVRAKGGFESTRFLVNPRSPRAAQGADHFQSTQRSDFNSTNSDVNASKPPRLGARRQQRMEAIVKIARDLEPVEEPIRADYTTLYKANSGTAKPIDESDVFDYGEDQPVTLYTGNPDTGAVMKVTGKSAGTGRNTMSRNANFSIPITQHPIGGKHKTPAY